MKIILVGSYRYEIYSPALFRAFQLLGHEVYKLDWEDYKFKDRNNIINFCNKFQDRFIIGPSVIKINRILRQMVKDLHPDLVFLYRCVFICPNTVKYISEHTFVFSYHNDDPFEPVPSMAYNRHYRRSAQYCNLNYVYRSKNLNDLESIGVYTGKILLPYYIEERNFYINCKKDVPIAFIGHWEDDGRDDILKALNDANIGLQLYGPVESWHRSKYWSTFKNIFHGEVVKKEYNLLLNRTEVCLVFFSHLNNDTYTRRCFEIPVAHGVMLSEYTDNMNRMFPEGVAAVYFRNKQEAVKKAQNLLSNSIQCREIGKNAFQLINKIGGSNIDRAKEIIEDYLSKKK